MLQTKRFSGLAFFAIELLVVAFVLIVDLSYWPVAVLVLGILIVGVAFEVRARRTAAANQ